VISFGVVDGHRHRRRCGIVLPPPGLRGARPGNATS
jgi:hypothetical protein